MQKANSLEKDPDLGKDWRQKQKGAEDVWQYINGHEFEQIPGNSERQGSLECLQSTGSKWAGHDWVTEQQQNTKSPGKYQNQFKNSFKLVIKLLSHRC